MWQSGHFGECEPVAPALAIAAFCPTSGCAFARALVAKEPVLRMCNADESQDSVFVDATPSFQTAAPLRLLAEGVSRFCKRSEADGVRLVAGGVAEASVEFAAMLSVPFLVARGRGGLGPA